MPFVGIQKSTGKRINILELQGDPRTQINKSDLACPLCGGQLTVVAGAMTLHHFRHVNKCTSTIERHPESIFHLAGKWYVHDFLRKKYGSQVTIEEEVLLPAANRQADIMVTWKTGFREVHEIQLASITTEFLSKRTADYRNAEIDVVWWLGGKADTPANRKWCIDTFGDIRTISFGEVSYNET